MVFRDAFSKGNGGWGAWKGKDFPDKRDSGKKPHSKLWETLGALRMKTRKYVSS